MFDARAEPTAPRLLSRLQRDARNDDGNDERG
jgi:hypothetical protein